MNTLKLTLGESSWSYNKLKYGFSQSFHFQLAYASYLFQG